MNKYEIVRKIEKFAPIDSAEKWDCVGFMVETSKKDVSKIMICLTPTDDVVAQARKMNCDMIVAHHPAFFVPLSWSGIDIYSAHTNMDKANGGTSDTIIKVLGYSDCQIECSDEFLRIIEFENSVDLSEVVEKLKRISPNMRYVNNENISKIKKVAVCAGSGSEFISDAKSLGCDALITGDMKFHTALDSKIVVFDIGHFESEILIRPVFKNIIGDGVEVIFAEEKSPFIY